MKPRRILRDGQRDAHVAVARAIVDGVLQKHPPACCVCFEPGRVGEGGSWSIEYHHWSYLVEHHLDVAPVCDSCHSLIHMGALKEPRTGKFRAPEQQTRRVTGTCPRQMVRRLADGREPFDNPEDSARWQWARQWLDEHPRPKSWPARKAWIQSCPRHWEDIERGRRAA